MRAYDFWHKFCSIWFYGALTLSPLGDVVVILNRKYSYSFIVIYIFGISYVNARRWMFWDPSDFKSTLVRVMVWCYRTSHYLNQCCLSSMVLYGVTRGKWVNGGIQISDHQWMRNRWVRQSVNHFTLETNVDWSPVKSPTTLISIRNTLEKFESKYINFPSRKYI